MSPDNSTPLYVGDAVEFVVEIEYSLAAQIAEVALVIDRLEKVDGEDKIGETSEVVLQGVGKVLLRASIQVPDTGGVRVYAPMFLDDESRAPAVDSRLFKVEERR